MKRLSLTMLSLLALFMPALSFAHSTGASWQQTIGNYIIDVGYDPIEPRTGIYEAFDFNIKDLKNTDFTNYDQVWVRILKDKETLLATGVHHQDVGRTTLLYEFAQPGAYTIEVSYRKGTDELAVASFPIIVSGSASSSAYEPVTYALLGFLIGAAAGYSFLRFRAVKVLT